MNYEQRIKDLRQDKDLKQSEVVQLLGTTQSYYAQYENGKHPLPIEHLIRLCIFYEISHEYILCFTNEAKHLPKKIE